MTVPQWLQSVTELDEVDSTNSYIQRELLTGSHNVRLPWLVNAHRQTAGRGRNAKTWLSDENSLTFSIAWSADGVDPNRLSQLPLHVGIAISDAIRPLVQTQPKVKWPNDIMLAGRKTSGILIEGFKTKPSSIQDPAQVFVIGVGINCDVDLAALDVEVASRSTSVRAHLKPELQFTNAQLRTKVLHSVLERLPTAFDAVQHDGEPIEKLWSRYCFLTGRYVAVRSANEITEGECLGIDERGAIILRESSGHWHTILSGEVVRY
jgi:BirA family biotin operon repressor/biotin-[acetyl-CoA-carboxylase] ligase